MLGSFIFLVRSNCTYVETKLSIHVKQLENGGLLSSKWNSQNLSTTALENEILTTYQDPSITKVKFTKRIN